MEFCVLVPLGNADSLVNHLDGGVGSGPIIAASALELAFTLGLQNPPVSLTLLVVFELRFSIWVEIVIFMLRIPVSTRKCHFSVSRKLIIFDCGLDLFRQEIDELFAYDFIFFEICWVALSC